MVLARAHMLTRLGTGVAMPIEAQCLTPDEKCELWADAIACDWRGDLAMLPATDGLGHLLPEIRSPSMLRRMLSLGIAGRVPLAMAAVRNG
ncbi:hypothetical protein HK105_207647 [Polyrhizophydium stewartii]|uniref:Uncharacterized protein n=1 Tax=Polyrhizophydium stewartii TaxID=2732419 RepID=A0ABR4N022_9FUNG